MVSGCMLFLVLKQFMHETNWLLCRNLSALFGKFFTIVPTTSFVVHISQITARSKLISDRTKVEIYQKGTSVVDWTVGYTLSENEVDQKWRAISCVSIRPSTRTVLKRMQSKKSFRRTFFFLSLQWSSPLRGHPSSWWWGWGSRFAESLWTYRSFRNHWPFLDSDAWLSFRDIHLVLTDTVSLRFCSFRYIGRFHMSAICVSS